MRSVTYKDKLQRGCVYCLDYQKRKYLGVWLWVCIHNKCPYRELDEFRTYRQYLISKGDTTYLNEK